MEQSAPWRLKVETFHCLVRQQALIGVLQLFLRLHNVDLDVTRK